MSFENLPENWPELPLSDPGLAADVVDLVLRDGDRMNGVFMILPADENGIAHPSAVMLVDDPHWHAPEGIRPFLAQLAELGIPAVLVALGSIRHLSETLLRRWRDVIFEELARGGTEVIGIYSADLRSVEDIGYGQLPGDGFIPGVELQDVQPV